jgi:hypothetical protein
MTDRDEESPRPPSRASMSKSERAAGLDLPWASVVSWLLVVAVLPLFGSTSIKYLSGPALMAIASALTVLAFLAHIAWRNGDALLAYLLNLIPLAFCLWISKFVVRHLPTCLPTLTVLVVLICIFLYLDEWPSGHPKLPTWVNFLMWFVFMGTVSGLGGVSVSVWRSWPQWPRWLAQSELCKGKIDWLFVAVVITWTTWFLGAIFLSAPSWVQQIAPALWFLFVVSLARFSVPMWIVIPAWLATLWGIALSVPVIKRMHLKSDRHVGVEGDLE